MARENWKFYAKKAGNGVSPASVTEELLGEAVNLSFFLQVQTYLQHYTEPSTDPLPVTNSTLSNTILPLGPGTFTHNFAGIPIIVTCTKADLIDDGNDMVAGTSGMGSMVKGKGGEWEERTDGVMQVLRTICLKCEYP